MGGDKLWIEIAGRPLLAHTLAAVAAAGVFDSVVVVAPEPVWPSIRELAAALPSTAGSMRLVPGGERRQDSVRAGLAAVDAPAGDVVCVHDAARPLCPPELFAAVVAAARETGAATTAVALVDSVKRVDATGMVVETLDRDELVAVQTPQAFTAGVLREAHARALAGGLSADDDAALVEWIGHPVRVVPGDPCNVKVTTPFDVALMAALLAARST